MARNDINHELYISKPGLIRGHESENINTKLVQKPAGFIGSSEPKRVFANEGGRVFLLFQNFGAYTVLRKNESYGP